MLRHIKAQRSSRWDEIILWDRGEGEGEKLLHNKGYGVRMEEEKSLEGQGEQEDKSISKNKKYLNSYSRRCNGWKCWCFYSPFSLCPSTFLFTLPSSTSLLPLQQCNLLKPYSTDEVTALDKVSCCSKKLFPTLIQLYSGGHCISERGTGKNSSSKES